MVCNYEESLGAPQTPPVMVGVFYGHYLKFIHDLHRMKAILARYRAELLVGGLVFLALLLKDLF